ncbi:MAG: hypothetical protein ACRELV_13970, partial [Longimicrobiales bacterium]
MIRTSAYTLAPRGRPAWASGAALAVALLAAPSIAAAQEPAVDSLRSEIVRLDARLDSLELLVLRLRAGAAAAVAPDTVAPDTVDPLAVIRAAAQAAAAGGAADTTAPGPEPEPEFIGRQRNLSQFNPEISVTGDVLGLMNADEPGENNFVPLEFEVAFQSNLDPYSRAKVFVAHHQHGLGLEPFAEHEEEEPPTDGLPEEEQAHEEGAVVEIEEGYVEWIALPGGLGLTVGKFRQRFGTLNRWHRHALPGPQLPLPYVAFLGEEGLAQAGLSVHWLAPWEGFGTYEVWGELSRGSSETIFGGAGKLAALAHLNAFYELSPAAYVEVGGSFLTGRRDELGERFGTRVYGLDGALSWRPPARAKFTGATLRAGYVRSERDAPAGVALDADGGFLIGEYQFAQRWHVGARYEWTENPA